MTHRFLSAVLIAALFLGGSPLSQADTISQTDDTATASAPDLIPGFGQYFGYTYTYGLGTGLSGTLNSLKLKFDGRPDNGWAVEFFCKTSAVFTGGNCPSTFGSATSLTPSSTGDGTAEYTAAWSGTNTFESDKFYFFQLRVDQNVDQTTPSTLSGSSTDVPVGTCESDVNNTTDGFCTSVPDPYFVLDFTPPTPADTTPPAIVLEFGPAEGQHVASSTPYFGFSSDDPSATYQCAWDGAATSSCASPASAPLADGPHSFAVVAADAALNSSAPTTVNFVVDTAAPALADVPADMTVEATGASTTVAYTLPTALDAGDGATSVACDPASGFGFSLGSTTVSCTSTDLLGHTATSTFVVSVVDTTAPTISNTPADMVVEAAAAQTPVSYTLPEAFDAISGTTTVSCAPASGSDFALGSTTVACSTQDAAGNIASSTFAVSMVDTTAPVLTLNGAATINLTVGDTFTDPGASATDLGTAISVLTSGSVDTSTAGSYTLTYSATDASGNSASTTRTITVAAPPPPPPSTGGGNGPPVANPSQGLPQGLILGEATNAVQNASERAIDVIKSILPPAKATPPGAPKQTDPWELPEVQGAQDKKETKAEKKAEQPSITPWDLPVAKAETLSSATANAEVDSPWTLLLALIAMLLIVLAGFAFRARQK